MSRVLVTGAEGFTGHYLVAELLAAGYEVHGLVRQKTTEKALGAFTTSACDLLDSAALTGLVARIRPAYVVHLAAIAFVGHGDVDAIYRTNVVGTRNLLSALSAEADSLSAVLLASSANVYGNSTAGVIDEKTQPAPANDYAVSKLAMEYMAGIWADRLPINIVRPFNYTGIGQSVDFLLPKIVDHYRRKAPVLELGNLDVERDFSDVRTTVNCYRRLLNTPANSKVFNVCSGQGHTLRAVLDMAQQLSGHSLEVRVNSAFVRTNDVKKLIGSKVALEAAIGPVTGPDLRQTLEWMLSAYSE
ncbi:MAG: GDP-mannose 4,6-dehydratase [Pseudomonadota bacterium]